ASSTPASNRSSACATSVPGSVPTSAAFLGDLHAIDDARLVAMGNVARSLVESHFTWNVVATQMADVYGWLIGLRDQPPCVID
ncbi:hypothetical protein, partial [Streptomyces sp. NPDC005538]|uniref:glycosyltransferase n=1 Tax=Streptomyces sp. NPDC005538 TaxID=3157043 RepID=UPI0033A77BF2